MIVAQRINSPSKQIQNQKHVIIAHTVSLERLVYVNERIKNTNLIKYSAQRWCYTAVWHTSAWLFAYLAALMKHALK
jgi:hypothetical protein